MVPETIFEIHDESQTQSEYKENKTPLFMMGFSSDKGPEELTRCNRDDFFKLYGTDISFKKHGQPLLQAANTVMNGGTIIAKRVVAPDATLANIALVAKVKQEKVQKKNEKGQLLYTEKLGGKETTESEGNTPIMINTCKIKYEFQTTSKAKNIQPIVASVGSLLNDKGKLGEYTYPLFIITDNGRGNSRKKIRISPDYSASRYYNYIKYIFSVIEDDEIIENIYFTFDPTVIEKGKSLAIGTVLNKYSKQVKCKAFEDCISMFIEKVAELSDNDLKYCQFNDLLFGCEKNNNKLNNITIDEEDKNHVNLTYVYGISLDNGTNGSFKEEPFGTDEYTDELEKLFNGTFDANIYDYDNYKIDVIVDANYPDKVKRAIEQFVTFREDIFYFRDFGLDIRSMDDILQKNNNPEIAKNRYSASYFLSYDIVDPFTRKQEHVTIGYSLSRLLINHFLNGRNRPLAGILYNFGIPEAVEGTVNFIPKITPSVNEKRTLIENKINYGGYYDGVLTLETLYTSQDMESQFSYINNVLSIQEVIKAVRERCPRIRYSFLNGKDLEGYKRDIQNVLNKYSDGFTELSMKYVQDKTKVAQKIFYATISVKFKDFVQTEFFKIYAFN